MVRLLLALGSQVTVQMSRALPLSKRPFDAAIVAFLISHIPITILIDSQACTFNRSLVVWCHRQLNGCRLISMTCCVFERSVPCRAISCICHKCLQVVPARIKRPIGRLVLVARGGEFVNELDSYLPHAGDSFACMVPCVGLE